MSHSAGSRSRTSKKKDSNSSSVQLFLFGANNDTNNVEGSSSGRPVRKPKQVTRFEPGTFDTKQTSCKIGEGFSCPRCRSFCRYDSRACKKCKLECYYEAGVGVVTLGERPTTKKSRARSSSLLSSNKLRSAKRRRASRQSNINLNQNNVDDDNDGYSTSHQGDSENAEIVESIITDSSVAQAGSTSTTNSECNNNCKLPEELRGLDKELVNMIYKDIVDSGEKVTFDDIAGLESAKAAVRHNLILPMQRPDLFEGLYAPKTGLLLFGPPGAGKTMIGKAIAHHVSGATFFSISSASLTGQWQGQGQKLVETLFEVAYHHAPSVIFCDEVDSLLSKRRDDECEDTRRIKSEFFRQLDGVGNQRKGHVLFIGATNRPWDLDPAMRRRFQVRQYIPLPNEQARRYLIHNLLQEVKHRLTNDQVIELSYRTHGYSGADLKELCKDAARLAMFQLDEQAILEMEGREDFPPVLNKHFCEALRCTKVTVAQNELGLYEEWNAKFGNE